MLFWFYFWNRFDVILTRIHIICWTVLWWESEDGSTWKFPSSALLDSPSFRPVGWWQSLHCPCSVPGGSPLGAASFIGSQVAPRSRVQLSAFLGGGTKEWSPFCSAVVFFLIVSFYFFILINTLNFAHRQERNFSWLWRWSDKKCQQRWKGYCSVKVRVNWKMSVGRQY